MGQVKKVNKVRTYDCIYCKRGFTKAQALGGHMNLHGKTRAKAKTVASHDHFSPPLSHKAKNDSDYNITAYEFKNSTPFSGDNCGGPWPAVNHLIHLPTGGLSFSRHNYPVCSTSLRRRNSHENLSSRIGPEIMVGGDDEERKEEVDVELRLGLKP